MGQKSVRGKHEIKATVIRGSNYVYIYIYSWNRRENSRREKKRGPKSGKEKKRDSTKKGDPPEILERTKGPVENRVVENHSRTITAPLNLRYRERERERVKIEKVSLQIRSDGTRRFEEIRVACLSGNNRSDRLDWSNAGKFGGGKRREKRKKGRRKWR